MINKRGWERQQTNANMKNIRKSMHIIRKLNLHTSSHICSFI